ncbi:MULTISPECIES: helix-turn-helix domain-containing protein [Paenibacillus]|uniref:Helix-turn-helix domain-containing protein n=1 Tax=Paenibacillus residui TaxID=629724 RepID=A0ABW3DBJ8_9BACL|nr:helix-turn-helix transcriptional regulator [Paenibacillus sp. 32O-W]
MKIIARPNLFARTRIMKGMSQRELARRSGLSHTYISMLERSKKSVGPAAAKKLSDVLEIPMDELFIIK